MSKSKNLAQISAKIDVDANGDVSPEVMANVVAELQFLRKRVTSLEEEITYLKAA